MHLWPTQTEYHQLKVDKKTHREKKFSVFFSNLYLEMLFLEIDSTILKMTSILIKQISSSSQIPVGTLVNQI